jgi:peptide/nickel transport system substrate-binding protein
VGRRLLGAAAVTSLHVARLAAAIGCCSAALALPGEVRAPVGVDRGGILHIVVSADFGSIEPALVTSYDGMQLMTATQLSLLSFQDVPGRVRRRLIPYGATKLPTISPDGTTYVFRTRRGLRFSDGSPVTAANFRAGFERVLDPRLHSPRAWLFEDIRGARAFTTGKAARLAGVVANGNRLVVRLTGRAPDILTRLALPVVTAMPLDLPIVPGGVEAPLASAGPYFAERYEPGRLARLVRNRFWNAAVLPSRPANVDAIEYRGRSPDEAAAEVSRGDADVATFSASEQLAPDVVREFARRYGVNRRRFFVRPRLGRVSVVFNMQSSLFRDVRLRRAVSFVLDRTRLVAAHGPFAGQATDQLLLPGRPAFRNWNLYPYRGDIVAGTRLARGALRRKDVTLYVPTTPSGPAAGSVIRTNLARLGLRVHVITLATPVFASVIGLGRTRWDLAVWGWNPARDDPVAFINLPLDGKYIGLPRLFNVGRFNDRRWNVRMRRVAQIRRGRDAAFARLDRDLMTMSAPVAPYLVPNALTILSGRVGCASWMYNGWPNLAGLCIR